MKNRLYTALLAMAAVAAATTTTQAAAQSYGAYGSSAVTPTIYSKNVWYSVAPPVVGTPPSNATVTNVYYSWTYSSPRPAGFTVYLCDNSGSLCSNVTSMASGVVNFSGYGVMANTPMRFYARVNGTGTMSPLYGGQSRVTVNYTY